MSMKSLGIRVAAALGVCFGVAACDDRDLRCERGENGSLNLVDRGTGNVVIHSTDDRPRLTVENGYCQTAYDKNDGTRLRGPLAPR